MIFATASRYLTRRNAMQTVYYRWVEDESGSSVRLVKHVKLCVFKGKPISDQTLEARALMSSS